MLTLVSSLVLLATQSPVIKCAEGAATEKLAEGQKVQKEKGDLGADEALPLYKEALKLDPKCATALWELGWSHQAKSRWTDAIAAWDQLKALDADYPDLAREYPLLVNRRDAAASLDKLPPLGKLAPREEAPSDGDRIHLGAVGDVNLGRGWPEARKAQPPDITKFFDGVKDLLTAPDVTIGNLETVLADSGDSFKCSPNSTHCYAFRVPTAWGAVLKDAGFDGLSIANNHAGDFGPAGRKTTMAALDAQGIKHSGPIGDLGTMTVKGKKIALVGMAFGSDMYRIQDIAIDQRLIALLKKSNDLVVVIFHAGAEGSGADHTKPGTEKFLGEDRGDSIKFAHAMIDAGADLMIGAGPHLLRAMERYRGRLIAYSLGNFSSWETFGLGGSGGISGVLTVDLAPNGVATAVKLTPTLLEKPGKPMPDPKAQGVARVRQLSREDFGDAFLDEQGSWSLK